MMTPDDCNGSSPWKPHNDHRSCEDVCIECKIRTVYWCSQCGERKPKYCQYCEHKMDLLNSCIDCLKVCKNASLSKAIIRYKDRHNQTDNILGRKGRGDSSHKNHRARETECTECQDDLEYCSCIPEPSLCKKCLAFFALLKAARKISRNISGPKSKKVRDILEWPLEYYEDI